MTVRRLLIKLCGFMPIHILLWPSTALAVQAHGGVEGLVSHQLAHTLFIGGIIYLFCKIKLARFTDPGWFEFKAFLLGLVCWNLLALTGHWMRGFVDPGQFSKVENHVVDMTINGPWDVLFYLTRLDHLLLLPAYFLLLLALRKWRALP